MKNISTIISLAVLLTLICGLLFAFDNSVLAYSSAADNGALDNPFNETTLVDFFEAVIAHLQDIIAFLSVMFIIIGGVLYIMASGNTKMATAGKICIVFAIIGLALAAGGPSFLRQIRLAVYGDFITPIPNDLSLAPTIQDIVVRVIMFLLSIVGMLAIIGLTISGIMYVLATGDSTQAQNAKKAMMYSIVGIVFAGASLLIVRQIIIFFTP